MAKALGRHAVTANDANKLDMGDVVKEAVPTLRGRHEIDARNQSVSLLMTAAINMALGDTPDLPKVRLAEGVLRAGWVRAGGFRPRLNVRGAVVVHACGACVPQTERVIASVLDKEASRVRQRMHEQQMALIGLKRK